MDDTTGRSNVVSPYIKYKAMADDTIKLQIFDMVERNSKVSQGKITSQTGLAAGLVHSFMKHIIEKGWVRAKKVSAKRWLYFMTPDGVVEKGRLAMNYIARTLQSYKVAKAIMQDQLDICRKNGWLQLVVAGDNEFADIAALHIEALPGFTLHAVLSKNVPSKVDGGYRVMPFEAVESLQFDKLLVCDPDFMLWYESGNRSSADLARFIIITDLAAHYRNLE